MPEKSRDAVFETKIPFPVDDGGFYTADAPGFEGARVIDDNGKKGDANDRVIKALIERNALFARGRLKHQYPHSWRSKKPVIFRNTPQWFVYMDKTLADGTTLRTRALKAIDDTRFVPAAGQNRLRAMIEQRPDWVLSRQRAWGVPICVFVDEQGEVLQDDAVNQRILDAFDAEGADAWFAEGAKERFLGNEHDPAKWSQVMDILDVWFDSGSTHTFTLEDRPDLKWPADRLSRKVPTSIAAGSIPRCWNQLRRVAARLTTPLSPMVSLWTRRARRCRSRRATSSLRRT